MLKCISLAILLAILVVPFTGCRFVAPGLESLSGAGSYSERTKTDQIIGQWARDTRKNERFVDTYFLNYDINDPYRGDYLVGY